MKNSAKTTENCGGVYVQKELGYIRNCILFSDGVETNNCSTVYSDRESSSISEGMISVNPGFMNPAKGGYILSATSPCIDAGDPALKFEDGCLPPGRGANRNDMGAYGGPGNCGWLRSVPDLDGDGVASDVELLDWLEGCQESPGSPVQADLFLDGRSDFYDLILMMMKWKAAIP